jgi:hypothetical protein
MIPVAQPKSPSTAHADRVPKGCDDRPSPAASLVSLDRPQHEVHAGESSPGAARGP